MLKMSQKMRQTKSTFMMEGIAPKSAFTTTWEGENSNQQNNCQYKQVIIRMYWLSSEQCYVEPRLINKSCKNYTQDVLKSICIYKSKFNMKVGKRRWTMWKKFTFDRYKCKTEKKTLERRDEVTTFCLTVNEKKTHNKEKNYRSKAPHKQHQKTMPQTARYSNPLKECKESHAERRKAMLNRQVSCHKHAVIRSLHKTKTFNCTWTQFYIWIRKKKESSRK